MSTSALGNVFVFVLTFALSHHKSSGPDFNLTLRSGEGSLSSRPLCCGRGSSCLASAQEEKEGEGGGGGEGRLFFSPSNLGPFVPSLASVAPGSSWMSPLCFPSRVSCQAAGDCVPVPHLYRKPRRGDQADPKASCSTQARSSRGSAGTVCFTLNGILSSLISWISFFYYYYYFKMTISFLLCCQSHWETSWPASIFTRGEA